MAYYWYPKTCSERLGCIIEVTDPDTMTGLAKTCIGHSGDFGRAVGIPLFSGLASQAALDGDQDVYDIIKAQNIAGTDESATTPFLVFDEMRIGSVAGLGFTPLLVIYQGSLVAPGDSGEDPPDETFLANSFTTIKANNPGVTRVCLDQESWWTNGVVDAQHLQYYLTLVDVAHDFWPDVGVYSSIPERYTLYLNFAESHETHITRKANWRARCEANQALFDAVNTIYPSVYFINPVYNNETKRDLWYDDNQAICDEFAPGKPVYYFMWPRIHSSVDPTVPYISGTYWRSSFDKLHTINDNGGIAIFLTSSNPDPRNENPIPDWWTETLDFINDNAIEEEA